MARIIKKSASEKGEVVIKEPSRIGKLLKKIKPKHLLYAWDVIASCLVVTCVVLLCVRFWPSKTETRAINSIELAINSYYDNLSEGSKPVVEEILAEDLIDTKITEYDQIFVYAYNPDVEGCTSYWETNDEGAIKYIEEDSINWSKVKKYGDGVEDANGKIDYNKYKGQYKYDEDKDAYKISTGLYEQNSAIIIDLIARLEETNTLDNMWKTKLYVIDLSKKANRCEISKIGGNEVSIDLTTEGLSQLLYLYNTENDKTTKIGGETVLNSSLRNYMVDIQANLYIYVVNVHWNDTSETFRLAYKDLLPMAKSYPNTDYNDEFYDLDGNPKYNWYTNEAHTEQIYPDGADSNIEYENGKYEFDYYGVLK